MRAVALYGPKDFRLVEINEPAKKDDNIILKVYATGICSSDMKTYIVGGHKRIKRSLAERPLIMGHEGIGQIVHIGDSVPDLELDIGNFAVIAPRYACEDCLACKQGLHDRCLNLNDIGLGEYDGFFAEYIEVPNALLKKRISPIYKLPEGVSPYLGAITEPLACVIRDVNEIVRDSFIRDDGTYSTIRGIKQGDYVVIIGGGPIGCIYSKFVRSKGGKVMLVQRSKRLEVARRLNIADYYFQNSEGRLDLLIEQVKKFTNGKMADVVIVACTNSNILNQAIELVNFNGYLSVFGGVRDINGKVASITFPHQKLHSNGPIVRGISSASPLHVKYALEFYSKGFDLTEIITHVGGLKDIIKFFNIDDYSFRSSSLKTIVFPWKEQGVDLINGDKSKLEELCRHAPF